MADYISREAAIKFAADGEYCAQAYHDRRSEYYYTNLKKALLKIPAADVAPVKRGKWVFKHHKMMGKTPCCTECGKFEPMIRNFCPNCGADMRGSNLDTTKGDSKDGKG